jgi:hypothetical protein
MVFKVRGQKLCSLSKENLNPRHNLIIINSIIDLLVKHMDSISSHYTTKYRTIFDNRKFENKHYISFPKTNF